MHEDNVLEVSGEIPFDSDAVSFMAALSLFTQWADSYCAEECAACPRGNDCNWPFLSIHSTNRTSAKRTVADEVAGSGQTSLRAQRRRSPPIAQPLGSPTMQLPRASLTAIVRPPTYTLSKKSLWRLRDGSGDSGSRGVA